MPHGSAREGRRSCRPRTFPTPPEAQLPPIRRVRHPVRPHPGAPFRRAARRSPRTREQPRHGAPLAPPRKGRGVAGAERPARSWAAALWWASGRTSPSRRPVPWPSRWRVVGVPIGVLPQLRDGLGVRPGQDSTDQVGDLIVAERADNEALDQVAGGHGAEDLEQRWMVTPGWVPIASDDEETSRGPVHEMAQQQGAGPVDAVGVFDDEQHRPCVREPAEDPHDSGVQRQTLVVVPLRPASCDELSGPSTKQRQVPSHRFGRVPEGLRDLAAVAQGHSRPSGTARPRSRTCPPTLSDLPRPVDGPARPPPGSCRCRPHPRGEAGVCLLRPPPAKLPRSAPPRPSAPPSASALLRPGRRRRAEAALVVRRMPSPHNFHGGSTPDGHRCAHREPNSTEEGRL